ncbi:MAG: hypothetical protein IKH33_09340 [Bacteroidales bacterium]|nr:hypothetical protein [Bacteroidales bacterium]
MNTNKQLIIIVLLCIVGTFCCKAQSLSSIEEQYIDQKSEGAVVVCINPSDNNSTIICYNDSLDYRPNFVYHTHTGTGVSKRFHWPLINNTFGEMTYKVNDMVIINGICYFCGKKHAIVSVEYSMEGLVIPFYQNTGFFGWFDVSQISSPSSTTMDLYLFDLPVMEELKRMDGIIESGIVELGLISEHTLALVRGYGSSWDCHVQDVASSERLEDVKITANHLVTLSRFLNSTYSFGLRCETKAEAFLSPITHVLNNYYNGTKYNTFLMTTASLPNGTPTRHYEDEVIRMVNHPGSDLVTVAYNGDDFDGEDCQHFGYYTPMYLMNFSNCSPGVVDINMSEAQLLFTSLHKPARYSLLEMCYVPTANAIAMLHGMRAEVYGMWSILQVSSWNSSVVPQSVQSDSKALTSMDVGTNDWAYMAGCRMPDNTICHYRQDGGMMERSCNSIRPATVVEKMIREAEEESVTVEPSSIPIFTITQTHFQIEATAPGYFPECKTKY